MAHSSRHEIGSEKLSSLFVVLLLDIKKAVAGQWSRCIQRVFTLV